ncbi:B12-binding domain-containing radical SAM protein [Proteinivorax hydrogeniformans]|uniref:B12-binding domain-containing radical SAM protein n=1 Tax=Proteinivorax hydrogeniformans TaxID=1826727 RepID=A0AAU8HW47_9FIRM
MNILLVGINAKYVHTNIAIRYLHQKIKDMTDVKSEIYEPSINNHLDEIITEVYRKKPEVVGFSCYIWNISMVLKICQSLKQILPNTAIILGGPEVSYEGKEFFNQHPYIDYIIKGEGEENFPKIVGQLEAGFKAFKIDGILTQEHDGGYYAGANVTDLPFPYDGEDMRSYKNKLLYYEASRGCPFNCSYCLSSTHKQVKLLPIDRIKKELKQLAQTDGTIKFVDRTFNCKNSRTIEILEFIKELNTNSTFHLEVTAHLLSKEVLKILSTMPKNRVQLEIGVQSTNPKTIKEINRTTDFNILSEKVKSINDMQNIHQHLDLIAGLPYEDLNSFQKSFDDVINLKPHKLQLGFLKMLKGSKVKKEAEKHGYKYNKFPPYEILENNYMSYSDISYLKDIEEVVETYYNSHKFDYTLAYILGKYSSKFKFFEELHSFVAEKGLLNKNLSHDNKFAILLEFGQQKFDSVVLEELLIFDYLQHKRTHSLPSFFRQQNKLKEKVFEFLKEEKHIAAHLPNLVGKRPTEIYKKIMVEKFDYNPVHCKKETVYILFDYTEKTGLFEQPAIHLIQL